MLWLLLIASGATPTPVGVTYLSCQWTNASGTGHADVAIDEAGQRVTIGVPSGRVVTRVAQFSPTEVRVPDEPMTWTFSRTDLKFQRTFSFMPPNDPGDSGTCAIAPMPAKRAF